jgi:hypothetical protein
VRRILVIFLFGLVRPAVKVPSGHAAPPDLARVATTFPPFCVFSLNDAIFEPLSFHVMVNDRPFVAGLV